MIHPHTELRKVSDDIGHGVFATALIPKGTMVYVKDELELEFHPGDRRIADPRYADIVETYAYLDPRGVRILSWDNARYVNHCCEPNTMSTGYNFEVALRDIQPGEQITDEYGLFNLAWELRCCCGAPGCRGIVHPDDADNLADQWDVQLKDALSTYLNVHQPLLPCMDLQTRRSVMRYVKTGKGYRSCRALRFRHDALAISA